MTKQRKQKGSYSEEEYQSLVQQNQALQTEINQLGQQLKTLTEKQTETEENYETVSAQLNKKKEDYVTLSEAYERLLTMFDQFQKENKASKQPQMMTNYSAKGRELESTVSDYFHTFSKKFGDSKKKFNFSIQTASTYSEFSKYYAFLVSEIDEHAKDAENFHDPKYIEIYYGLFQKNLEISIKFQPFFQPEILPFTRKGFNHVTVNQRNTDYESKILSIFEKQYLKLTESTQVLDLNSLSNKHFYGIQQFPSLKEHYFPDSTVLSLDPKSKRLSNQQYYYIYFKPENQVQKGDAEYFSRNSHLQLERVVELIVQYRKDLKSHIYLAPNFCTWIVVYPFDEEITHEPFKKVKQEDQKYDLSEFRKLLNTIPRQN